MRITSAPITTAQAATQRYRGRQDDVTSVAYHGRMAKSARDMDGWWVATGAELGGVRLPAEALSDLALRLRKGTFRFGTDEGWTVVHRNVRPQALDIVLSRGSNRGRVVPAIIDVSGSSMRICCDLSGRSRPQEFKAPSGTRCFLASYRRSDRL